MYMFQIQFLLLCTCCHCFQRMYHRKSVDGSRTRLPCAIRWILSTNYEFEYGRSARTRPRWWLVFKGWHGLETESFCVPHDKTIGFSVFHYWHISIDIEFGPASRVPRHPFVPLAVVHEIWTQCRPFMNHAEFVSLIVSKIRCLLEPRSKWRWFNNNILGHFRRLDSISSDFEPTIKVNWVLEPPSNG